MNDQSNRVHAGELLAFIERLEGLAIEKTELSDQARMVYAEAKSQGYAPAYIRAIIKLRAKPPSEREENAAMMEMYMAAVGMATETPLFRHVAGMGVDTAVKERVVEALRLLAPQEGEITIKVPGSPRLRIWRTKDGVQSEEVPDLAPTPAAPKSRKKAPARDVPDCTEDEAYDLGRAARRDDAAVITNPFPHDDKRRSRWDEGWRFEDGGDGMGPK